MKIKVDKEKLCEAVAPLMGAVSSKNTIAAVEGILITTQGDSAIQMTTFDLEKGFRIKIECDVIEAGSYIINGNRFHQIIEAMPLGELTISVDHRLTVKIVNEKSEFELSAINGSDFPALPEFKSDIKFTVNQGVLRQMIAGTSFAVAVNENRAALNGAYFVFTEDQLKIVACDGNRLAIREQKCNLSSVTDRKPEVRFILPGKTLMELMKILKNEKDFVTITVTRRNGVFETGGLLFFSRLIDGEYLDYTKFIPQSSRIKAEIETEQFIESLERAILVSEDKTLGQTKNYVRCNFGEGMLKITSESVNGRVYDEIYVSGVEGELEIGFNCKFLLDALRACGTERVLCEMNSPLSCMIITPAVKDEKEDFLYLVLPIRMKG